MYFKALVTSYFVDLIIIIKHTLTTYIHFNHLKIADLQAHNALHQMVKMYPSKCMFYENNQIYKVTVTKALK